MIVMIFETVAMITSFFFAKNSNGGVSGQNKVFIAEIAPATGSIKREAAEACNGRCFVKCRSSPWGAHVIAHP